MYQAGKDFARLELKANFFKQVRYVIVLQNFDE